ncbi:hypothetical protein LCGC14_1229150 [marine sediment metagenome]|uniref:Uncharacterized protein n=1 Tax=marine sediment metagenome TaxID=412755 RepID=A0A0F9LD39_9ZZZZ
MRNTDKEVSSSLSGTERKRKEPSKDEVDKMYGIANRLANSFYTKYFLTYLDKQDFVQEAMLGWLQGRPMLYAMMDAFRKAAPLARSQIGKLAIPRLTLLTWGIKDPNAGEETIIKAVLLSQLREVISEKMDEVTQDVMNRYFFKDGSETLKEIGKSHGVTGSNIYLKKRKALKKLEEVCNNVSKT